MPLHHNFLVIDDNADSRFLLVKTLLRKFPRSVIHECQSADAAVSMVTGTPALHAIVTHRAVEMDGISVVQLLRQVNATVPIVMVSGIDRSAEALAAGANRFLNYDEWLRIGTLVAEMLGGGGRESTPPFVRPARPAS